MSLRPEIIGFSLAKMRSHFGSKDAATIEHIVSRLEPVAREFERRDAQEARSYRDKVSETARTIVMEGAPINGLDRENDIHFGIAAVLATYQQESHDVESNAWKMGAFEAFQDSYGGELEADAQPLLNFFLEGRPLFGRAMEIDWSYYAYLTHEEVRTLLSALRKLQQDDPSLVGESCLDGFVDALIGWLAAIDERSMDLFLYTA